MPIQVSPPTNDFSLSQNQIWEEKIKVTIPKSGKATKVDVYFLADTTGSMNTAIAAVKSGISAVLDKVVKLVADVQFGVGDYKDFPAPDTGRHPYAFANQHPISSDISAIKAAINAWKTTPGRDTPEAQFYALDRLAQDQGGEIAWRADSKRIILWFGDAAGHDPICKEIAESSDNITEESLTAKLVAQEITVLALSMGTNYRAPAGLDDDPQKSSSSEYRSKCGDPGGTPGQGTRIAHATGGKLIQGVNPNEIVDTIIAELSIEVTTISDVRLVPSVDIEPFVSGILPENGYGSLSKDQDHELTFDVSWLGNVPCKDSPQVFNGSIDVIADGQIVGSKTVKITVPRCVTTQPLPPINNPEGEIMPRPDDVSDTWMLIHQVTGTYFFTDNYTSYPSSFVQNWNQNPILNEKTKQGYLWVLSKQPDGTYLIRSWQNNVSNQNQELYLEAAENTDQRWNDSLPTLQPRNDQHERQSWVLVPVSGDPDTYAIQPKLFPNNALGLHNNVCTNDRYVIANPTWGKPTFHHYWRLSKPPVGYE